MKLTQFMLICAVTLGLPFGANAGLQLEGVKDGVAQLQTEWARIKYEMTDEDAQLEAIHKLEAKGQDLITRYPDTPELLTWQGIILATDAGIVGGISALGKVDDARELFKKSIAIDSAALNGSAYTSLGALYYQVPPWPLAFGSDDKAKEFLLAGLALNPDGIDSNYFFGDFMRQNDQLEDAKAFFEKALKAPDRPDRPTADAGRRAEIKQALKEINQELAD
ncbi:tetratricopeptide repeat protein [Thalassospira lucentensis]|uniref:tetratricopeptide repeat protein n=1 Tax=Thalassospira lucentensis TaxID=168935 RepID=UPI00142DEAAD|nr:hypothetical protein [Thalassospira lucentensis]NIZ03697.1 hypothetical protein [Thalassospira lucentensis]